MNKINIFDVCGRVNGYYFIERVMGISQMSFSALRDFREVQDHVRSCGDCAHRVDCSVAEFSVGNPRFSMRRYNAGLKYIELAKVPYRNVPNKL